MLKHTVIASLDVSSEYALVRDIAVADENSAYLGVERRILMENAGAEVARFVEEKIGDLKGRRIVVLAGPGNNGGDAMVAARHMAARGASVSLFLLSEESRIRTAEASSNWEIVKRMSLSIDAHTITGTQDIEAFLEVCKEAEVVIDGIFGTGVRGEVREPARSVIEAVNNTNAVVFSIDVPSGMDPDTGLTPTTCVVADYTITLHRPKPFIARAEKRLIGEVVVRGIGAPPEAEIVAGPGDLSEALRSVVRKGVVRCISKDIEMAEAVREVAHALGLNASLESGDLGEAGYRLDVEGHVASDDEEYVMSEGDALYARFRPDTTRIFNRELADEVRAEARRLGRVVYIAGGVDYLSDGARLKTNWIEPAIPNIYCFGAAVTIATILRASGADRLYAVSGSVYAVRRALREMNRSFSREAFLNVLMSLLSNRSGSHQ